MGIKLRLTAALLAFCLGLCACKSTLPVDAVMDGGEVFFILESREAVSSVRVLRLRPEEGSPQLMWEARHNMAVPLEERKFLRLKHLRYGQAMPELPVTAGPLALERGAEYAVIIETKDGLAQDSFIITGDGGLVMPSPVFERQQGRIYKAVTGGGGGREFVLSRRQGGK
jgi:hypothetical protein